MLFRSGELPKNMMVGMRACSPRCVLSLDSLYVTDCPLYQDQAVPVKCWLWVKEIDSEACGEAVSLFPGYLLAENVHPKNVLVCSGCELLNEVQNTLAPGAGNECATALRLMGPARRGHCLCLKCQHDNAYPMPRSGNSSSKYV